MTRRATTAYNLGVLYPKIAAEWHPNNEGTPYTRTPKSGERVLWKCARSHSWAAQIGNRTNGGGCPYCLGKKATKDHNFATKFPELAIEWHPDNADMPRDVTPYSTGKRIWRCPQGHRYETSIKSRACGTGCPYCSGRITLPEDSIAIFPHLVREWHPDNLGDPRTLPHSSNRMVKWRCSNDPEHVWKTKIYHRVRSGSGCPFCSGRRATAEHNLAAKYPWLLAEWHPDNSIQPNEITPHAPQRVKWLCSFGHSYYATVKARTRNKGNDCRQCESLASEYPRTAAEWHPDNPGTPDEISSKSRKIRKWTCINGHTFWSSVNERVSQVHGCAECWNLIRAPNTYDFLAKAFAVHGNTYDYSRTNYIGSNKKLEINCRVHGVFLQTAYLHLRGAGCPTCGNAKRGRRRNHLAEHQPMHHGDILAPLQKFLCEPLTTEDKS